MKKIKVLLFVTTLVISNLVSASTDPETNGKINGKAIVKEISDLLKNPSFEIKKETTAFISIMLNKNNEVVVLSVDTENEAMEGYIKSRLNYKVISKLPTSGLRTFNVPVRFTSQAI